MTPSEVRHNVLSQHRRLRDHASAFMALCVECDSGEFAKTPETTTIFSHSFAGLVDAILHHLDYEEQVLAPCLCDIDAWGEARVEKLREEHAHQRHELDALRDEWLSKTWSPTTAVTMVAQAKTFIQHFMNDMDGEEHDTLTAELLHDDPLETDIFTG